MKRSTRGCFGLEMVGKTKTLTPPNPPLSGGESATPSPDKGRAGEGLKFLAYDKRLTALARENRQNPTPAETLIWQKVLRSKQFERYKFLRQKPIGPYIVDFYCSELGLIIEIDGDSHAEQFDYDAQRTAYLNSLGLRVLRYGNHDILNNLAGVYEHFHSQLENKQP
jgi:very-short-patch-repair endonuclease